MVLHQVQLEPRRDSYNLHQSEDKTESAPCWEEGAGPDAASLDEGNSLKIKNGEEQQK